jgi:hypothetical protein
MHAVMDMGWDEEHNHPITASEAQLDCALALPDPDSLLGQMFDFSEMEPLASDMNVSDAHPTRDVDTASANLDAFSAMSNFSRFYNPDGTECLATDWHVQWSDEVTETGDMGEPMQAEADLDWDAAHQYFQGAVDSAVRQQLEAHAQASQAQIEEQQQQIQSQNEAMACMQQQLEMLMKTRSDGNGDNVSAPSAT